MYDWANPSCNPPTIDCTKEDVKPELLLPEDISTNKRKFNVCMNYMFFKLSLYKILFLINNGSYMKAQSIN